ncbi:MAG: phosphatase PAP2 family protein [Bacteroidaceae bacterium]|nr:phosphatase PAP2 family protein [Bacteroidaceae bacterium]
MLLLLSLVRNLLLYLLLAVASAATALAQDTLTYTLSPVEDTLALGRQCQDSHRAHWHQIAVPAALAVGGGVLVTYSTAREGLRRRLQARGRNHDIHVDDYIQYAPYAANLFVGCSGVKSKHGLRGRVLMTFTAAVIQAGVTNAVKRAVREQRPRSGLPNSFPSGHTATAFTGAELCRIEYGWKVGGPAYAVAATVGFLRMWNDYHWYNDVLAGAALGVLSAQAANYLYPVERKLFRPLERRIAQRRVLRRSTCQRTTSGPRMVLAPSYDSVNAIHVLNFVALF